MGQILNTAKLCAWVNQENKVKDFDFTTGEVTAEPDFEGVEWKFRLGSENPNDFTVECYAEYRGYWQECGWMDK